MISLPDYTDSGKPGKDLCAYKLDFETGEATYITQEESKKFSVVNRKIVNSRAEARKFAKESGDKVFVKYLNDEIELCYWGEIDIPDLENWLPPWQTSGSSPSM